MICSYCSKCGNYGVNLTPHNGLCLCDDCMEDSRIEALDATRSRLAAYDKSAEEQSSSFADPVELECTRAWFDLLVDHGIDDLRFLLGVVDDLGNKADVGRRFLAHASAIWNAMFPEDKDGWEYGAQLERMVIERIQELLEIEHKYFDCDSRLD